MAGHIAETTSRGRSLRKQEGTVKNRPRKARAKAGVEERKAKGKEEGLTCCMSGGIGHHTRLCPSEGLVNDLEEDAPEGEDPQEDGCSTEEDDEPLQLLASLAAILV